MLPIQHLSSGVIAEIIRRQPSSPARTTLAWQLAVGTALARATTVELSEGVLTVHSPDPRWTLEITRARDVVLGRVQHYLGPAHVKTLRIEKAAWQIPRIIIMSSREAVIISAVRTPTGKFLGALKDLSAAELGARVVREAVRRAGIDPASVDECIMGNVIQAGNGQNPARQAALNGGLADHVAALTINKVCGSGLKAVMLAAQGIATGDIDIAVAGGMESMSNAPYLLPRVREGLRMGDGKVVDSLINDGLWCSFENCHMGISGEVVAEKYSVEPGRAGSLCRREPSQGGARDARRLVQGRDPADRHSAAQGRRDRHRHRRAHPRGHDRGGTREAEAGVQEGRLGHGGERARASTTRRPRSVIMAAEKARALGLTPMARVVGQATSGLAPKLVMMTPVEAVRKVATKVGWDLKDVDLFEINEAFSVQAVAVMRELGIDPARVNVHGGAVALGHAIGASGARVLTTLLYAMQRRGVRRGIAALCLGGGQRRGAGRRAE